MNSTALRAPSRLSLTALLFGLLLPFGALAEEAAPTAQAPVAATAANAQADTTQALPATPAQHPQAELVAITSRKETGMPVAEICRKGGFSDATFYKWRAKFGGMEASDAKRLRELEEENAKLKKLLAEAHLDMHALKSVLGVKR